LRQFFYYLSALRWVTEFANFFRVGGALPRGSEQLKGATFRTDLLPWLVNRGYVRANRTAPTRGAIVSYGICWRHAPIPPKEIGLPFVKQKDPPGAV